MSRTYRRNSPNKVYYRRKGSKNYNKINRQRGECYPPIYKNASRVNCAQSLSEKWLFHSAGAAKEAIEYNAEAREKRGKSYKYERSYFCKACNGYHITCMNKQEWSKRKFDMGIKSGKIKRGDNYSYENFSTDGGFLSHRKRVEW